MLQHGFNSHGGHYLRVGSELAARGFAVFAVDLRGRGRSEGERFYVESFDDYVDDLSRTVALAGTRAPGVPIFLLGHSAGGVISASFALDHPGALTGLICESFAFRVPAPDFALAALKGLSHIAPHVHVLRLKTEDFSRDPEIRAALLADPLIAGEVQPTQTVAEMVRADERLEAGFPRFSTPVLILHGSADKVTASKGSALFHAGAASADKTLKIYEGHAHDLLNDLGREEVLGDVVDWIEARIPA